MTDKPKNNIMRHDYRKLLEEEVEAMREVKDKGLEFVQMLHRIGGTADVEGGGYGSRELGIAAMKIEEAVMWATKHITK